MTRIYRRAVPLVGAAFLLFGAVVPAAALPVGPVEPEAHVGRFAIDGTFSYARRTLRDRANTRDRYDFDHRDLYLGSVAYGLTDRIEVRLRTGIASLQIADRPDVRASRTLELGSKGTIGGGVRGVLWTRGRWAVVLDGQYQSDFTRGGSVLGGGAILDDWEVREWQLAAALRADRDPLRPYVGVLFSDVQARGNVGGVRVPLEKEEPVGILVGTSYALARGWFGWLEGRLVSERALDVGLGYRF